MTILFQCFFHYWLYHCFYPGLQDGLCSVFTSQIFSVFTCCSCISCCYSSLIFLFLASKHMVKCPLKCAPYALFLFLLWPLTIAYMTPYIERTLSVFFCWSLDPDQPSLVSRFDSNFFLVNISRFSKTLDDIWIFSIPGNFRTWERLNKNLSLLSRSTSVSLRLNS